MFRQLVGKGIVLAAILCGAVISLSACGGGTSTASQQELLRAERHARQEKAEKERERKLERKLAKLERENRQSKKHDREELERNAAHVAVTPEPQPAIVESSPPSGSSTDCGEDIVAGPETSCGFAINVRNAYESEIGSGSGTVEAWSDANHQEYSMYCTSAPHECEGAITATVYFP
jgi:hypothetical protein